MHKSGPYNKLKPALPTPVDQICPCAEPYPIILCYTISENPILCTNCSLEVPPERLQLSVSLVDELASWRQFYSCFYNLWLDSSEFEDWARTHLSNPLSPANERGYKVCASLSSIRRCYYWWFQDTGTENFKALNLCPKCNAKLEQKFGKLVCDRCSIIVAN